MTSPQIGTYRATIQAPVILPSGWRGYGDIVIEPGLITVDITRSLSRWASEIRYPTVMRHTRPTVDAFRPRLQAPWVGLTVGLTDGEHEVLFSRPVWLRRSTLRVIEGGGFTCSVRRTWIDRGWFGMHSGN